MSSYLLWGLALASVPIIIHLLNRRRFQLIDWAPMKYLKLTIKNNRRRLRIEQLLLLALRTLLIIVLIAAVARPVLSATGLGRLFGGHSRTSRIIVIDDSLSMGYQTDRRSAFDQAKGVAAEIVKGIGSQDSVTVVATSSSASPLVQNVQMDSPAKVLEAIGKMQVSDTANGWSATLKAVESHLAAATFPVREVVILTDLRKNGWGTEVTEVCNRLAGQSVGMKIIDVGSRQTANVALRSLEQETQVALPGSTVALKAMIRNDQPTAVVEAQAVLSVGDEARPVILPELPPGKTTEIPLTVKPQEAGYKPLRLTLPGDALVQDNVRYLTMSVRDRIDVTMVDGEISTQPFESETDFLALALSVGTEPFHVQRVSDSDWAQNRPAAADVMVLANVANVPQEQVAALERMVKAGMGLMIFVGDQVDPALYNQRLFKEGQGLLPGKLGKVVEEGLTGIVVEQAEQSPLTPMARLAPAALSRVRVKKLLGVELPKDAEGVRTLARWNDPEAHPAVLEKRYGKGRVLLFTVTADKAWSDWPIDPTYVLAIRSTAMAIARGERQESTISAGQPIQLVLDEGQTALEAKVSVPGKEVAEAMTIERPEKGPVVLRSAATVRAGVYRVTWKEAGGREVTRPVSVNPERSESDLEPIADAELTALLGSLKAPIVHLGSGQDPTAQQGREIWKTLATILMTLVLVETVFAVWVGRER
ncbi:MAG: BatA domain-containing protein [Tepidisphaerales bacterium]